MSFGYDIGISENVDLGFKLSLTSGSFRTFKRRTYGITTTETLPENYAEGL